MKVEFEVYTDVYAPDGVKCIKKDVSYKKIFETDEIELENFIDNKGKVISKYTGVIYRDKYYKVNTPYDIMKQYTTPLIIKGLFAKSSYHEKDNNKIIKKPRGRR
jgi:hypothetical protein